MSSCPGFAAEGDSIAQQPGSAAFIMSALPTKAAHSRVERARIGGTRAPRRGGDYLAAESSVRRYQEPPLAPPPQLGSTGQTEELRSWMEKHLRDQGIDPDPADVQPDILAVLSALLPTSHETPASRARR